MTAPAPDLDALLAHAKAATPEHVRRCAEAINTAHRRHKRAVKKANEALIREVMEATALMIHEGRQTP